MIHYGLQNANSSVITVTNTATLLKSLIDTAGSVTHTFPGGLNGIDMFIEDGDVRILFDGNTPTASKGLLLKQGTVHHFRGVDFHQAKLIRAGSSNVAVDVQIGFVENNEEVTTSSGGSSSAGDTQTAGADAESNTANAQRVASRIYGFNGATWDRLRTAITTATSTFTGLLNVLGLVRYNSSAPTLTDGQVVVLQGDVNGNLKATLATLLAGEDLTNGVMKVEHQYQPSGVLTADTQVKGSAGFVHTVTISCNDAAPTAGSIIIYNSLTETGTQIFNHTFTTTPFAPFTVILDQVCSTGIYVGFTTTADVNVSVSYR